MKKRLIYSRATIFGIIGAAIIILAGCVIIQLSAVSSREVEDRRLLEEANAALALRIEEIMQQDELVFAARDMFQDASWSHDGLRILARDWDSLRIWDAATGTELFRLDVGDQERVHETLWKSDDSQILAHYANGAVRLWDTNSGEQRLIGVNGAFGAVWSHDESRILTWHGDPTIYDADTGELILGLAAPNSIFEAQWSRDDSRIFAWSTSAVRIWDANTGDELVRIVQEGRISTAQWSEDESRIMTATERGSKVWMWDAITGEQLLALTLPEGSSAVRLNSDGTRITTRPVADLVHVWDAETGEELFTLDNEHPMFDQVRIGDVHWNADESRVLADSGLLDIFWIWDTSRNPARLLLTLPEQRWTSLNGVNWNSDYSRIIAGGRDVRIWDAVSGEELLSLTHPNSSEVIGFNPDETRLLTITRSSGYNPNIDRFAGIFVWDVSDVME
ncbi:MAG: WD40 repeat domain-containing protein [Burkholderiales bacterium]|nr:WD40 repeat domain-containing protein [Anaerolineae bacterium]